MSLNISTLAADLKTQLEAVFGAPTDDPKLTEFCTAVATAVVNHIKSSAQVSGTVTSGAGAGGAVTGTVN